MNLEEHEKKQLLSKLLVPKKTVKVPESKQEVTAHDEKRALKPDQFALPSKNKRKQEPLEVLSPMSRSLKLLRKQKSTKL